jgi:hypothetical protein
MTSLRKILFMLFLFTLVGCATPRPERGPAQDQPSEALPTAVMVQVSVTAVPLPTEVVAQEAATTDEIILQPESSTANPAQEVAPLSAPLSEPAAPPAAPGACPVDHFLQVQAHPANAAYPAPQLNVTCANDRIIIQSNGIPNFEFVQITPSGLAAQNYQWEIPLTPQIAADPAAIPLGGPVAIAVNGIPIFGPTEAPQDDYGDPYLDGILDYCNGHTAQRGDYHFHARPDCLFETVDGQVGLVMGYAFDGYPILAPYLCQDESCASVAEVQSSWQRTQDVRNAWEAHQYVEGAGDLDRCNGKAFADGSYAYFATDTFPYFMGCYRGIANVPSPGAGGPLPGNNPGQNLPPSDNGGGQNPPPPGGPQGNGGPPDLARAAAQLGITEQQLREALGPPPPNFADTAAKLGISEQALRQALGTP